MHLVLGALLCWLVGGVGTGTAVWLMSRGAARRSAALADGPLWPAAAAGRVLELPRQAGPAD